MFSFWTFLMIWFIERVSKTLTFLLNLVLFSVVFSSHFNHISRLMQSCRRGGNHPFTFMGVVVGVIVAKLLVSLTSQWSQLHPKEDVSPSWIAIPMQSQAEPVCCSQRMHLYNLHRVWHGDAKAINDLSWHYLLCACPCADYSSGREKQHNLCIAARLSVAERYLAVLTCLHCIWIQSMWGLCSLCSISLQHLCPLIPMCFQCALTILRGLILSQNPALDLSGLLNQIIISSERKCLGVTPHSFKHPWLNS